MALPDSLVRSERMYEATNRVVVGLSLRYFHIVVCSAFLALRLAFGQDPKRRKGSGVGSPDVPVIRDELDRHVVKLHNLSKPLCWVEMATVSYPFYENIDIMGTSHDKPNTFNDAELSSQPLGATTTQMQGSKQLRRRCEAQHQWPRHSKLSCTDV